MEASASPQLEVVAQLKARLRRQFALAMTQAKGIPLRTVLNVALGPEGTTTINEIVEVRAIPRTLTGKKLEVPVKRLLQGRTLDEVVDLKTVDDPEAVRWFAAFADRERTP